MIDIPLPPQPCPSCGSTLDAASTTLPDPTARPGDITLCFHCAEILVFEGSELRARLIRAEELAALPAAAQAHLVRAADLLRSARSLP